MGEAIAVKHLGSACGCTILTRLSYWIRWAVFSALRYTYSSMQKQLLLSALILHLSGIIQHPNYMLSKITSILIIALWMHNMAAWGFVFPGTSAIRHQSLVCRGRGAPVDKEEHTAHSQDYQWESDLPRSDGFPELLLHTSSPRGKFQACPCDICETKLPFPRARAGKVRSQDNFCRSGREHSPALFPVEDAGCSPLCPNTSDRYKGIL